MINLMIEHDSIGALGGCFSEPLTIASNWIDKFITKPNEVVGRRGPVCPFVPRSIGSKKLFYALSQADGPHRDTAMRDAMTAKQIFRPLLGDGDPDDLYDCLVLVLPYLASAQGGEILRSVHFSLKPAFVSSGFMLGEFHDAFDNRGLHNESFLSARSPVPLLVLRRMVGTDIFFLQEEDEPTERRLEYIRHYLYLLRSRLTKAEIEYAETLMKKLEEGTNDIEEGVTR
jgi:hypothetical protein